MGSCGLRGRGTLAPSWRLFFQGRAESSLLECWPLFERTASMPKKIDPLNRKHYGTVSAMLTVSDIVAAAKFYQKAFGFAKRGIMNDPDGQPIHGELTLRGSTLMLGPE